MDDRLRLFIITLDKLLTAGPSRDWFVRKEAPKILGNCKKCAHDGTGDRGVRWAAAAAYKICAGCNPDILCYNISQSIMLSIYSGKFSGYTVH